MRSKYWFILFCFFLFVGCNLTLAQQADSVYTSLEEAIKNKTSVKYLQLNRKHLKAIPPEIFEMINLEELDLSKNKITEIPNEISQLKRLKKLNVSQNKLQALPSSIGLMTSLKDLLTMEKKFWGQQKFY